MNQPKKDPFHLYVLFESPFESVSTVSEGYPSLVSVAHPRLFTEKFYFVSKKTYRTVPVPVGRFSEAICRRNVFTNYRWL